MPQQQMTPEQIEAAQRKAIEPKSPIYRKLLAEKFEAKTEREKVLTSIIVAMAEDVDKIKRAIKYLSDQDIDLFAGLNAALEKLFGSEGAEGEQVNAAQAPASAGGDKTPFPAGANPTVVTGSAGPLPDEDEEGPPTPNVKSGPATNAAPIPKASGPKAPAPNAGPANGPAKGARP
jgi:hypothetical protein